MNEGTLSRAKYGPRAQGTRDVEISSLRAGHAALLVEVEKLKREVLKHSQRLSEFRAPDIQTYKCTSAGCVLSRLRHRVALKMQIGLRLMSSATGKRPSPELQHITAIRTGDGLHVGVLKSKVECTLQQFENIARQVRTTSPLKSTYFFPDFSHTQLPLQCSSAFRILFHRFSDLMEQIGIISSSDRLEMVRKCGTGPQGDLLRVLGTYGYRKDDTNSAAYIYLGSSCGSASQSDNSFRMPSDHDPEEPADQNHVLTRKTREWNEVDRRFVHPLCRDEIPLRKLDDNTSDFQAFALQWRRTPDPTSRNWSKSLTEPTQVFGWLEICLPFIQTQGSHLCTELGGKADDELWIELVGGEV